MTLGDGGAIQLVAGKLDVAASDKRQLAPLLGREHRLRIESGRVERLAVIGNRGIGVSNDVAQLFELQTL